MSEKVTIPPMTSNTLDTLVFSDCRGTQAVSAFISLLDHHALSLRHLSTESAPETLPFIENTISKLRQLETLVVHDGYILDTIFLQLPSSIVHISIRPILVTDQTLIYCAELIKNRDAHPKLCIIELFVLVIGLARRTFNMDQWVSLGYTAGKIGIQLLTKSDRSDKPLLPAWARE
jgi:hypothetical protein